jgi:phosphoribosyl-ATP pyrophosphohydrolase
MTDTPTLGGVIDELARTIASRAKSDPSVSYTAKLVAEGKAHCARKFGEEAVEAIIAATGGNNAALAAEGADVLYHFLVLLEASGVRPDDVAGVLNSRRGVSGHDEKAAR